MKKYMLFILLFVLFPLCVSAEELDLILKCPDRIKKNEEFKCELTCSSNAIVSALEYEFEVPQNVIYHKFEKDSIWEGDEEDNLILLYTAENKTGIFPIGEMYFTAKEDISKLSLNTSYLLFCDEEFNDHIIVNRKEENKDDVKEVKNKDKKEVKKRSYIILYVIILMIMGALAYLMLQRRKGK